jgi:hypothetical protein
MSAIVSLTTTSQRLAALPDVLGSLLSQSVPPTRIILWISNEPFLLDAGVRMDELPREVSRLARDNSSKIEIRVTENIGPHRKLLPLLATIGSLADAPPLVTADDDTLYPHRWLEALLAAYHAHGCAITFRARRIPVLTDRRAPYADWPLVPPYDEVFGYRLLSTGKDGLLVHPRMLHRAILDPCFRRLCPSRADVWIAAALFAARTPMIKLSLTKVFPDEGGLQPTSQGVFPAPARLAQIQDVKSNALYIHNASVNDLVISRTFDYFKDKACVAMP